MLPRPGPALAAVSAALVRFGDGLADREAEADAAKLARDLAIALLEGVEDAVDVRRAQSRCRCPRLPPSRVPSASARWVRERIVIVPPLGVNLIAFLSRFQRIWVMRALSARRLVFSSAKSRTSSRCFVLEIGPAGVDRVLDHAMEADALAMQLEFAAGDAGEIEQVIDQARFQLDIAPDGFEIFGERFRDGGVLAQAGENGEHGRERRAQLVAERGEKKILRLVGLLGRSARLLFRLVKPRHIHRGRRLGRDAENDFLVALSEDAGALRDRKTNRPGRRRSAK